jgi:hypothetical protein
MAVSMICLEVGMGFLARLDVGLASRTRKLTHQAQAGLAVSARQLIQINHDFAPWRQRRIGFV